MDKSVQEIYGNHIRGRVCGILAVADQILMVNHRGLTDGSFWSPPGGGIAFGVSVQENLVREFREETGLIIEVGSFLFVTERVRPPLHAVELFFSVTATGGSLLIGRDPEMGDAVQLIQDVRFMLFKDIDALQPEEKHGAFGLTGAGRIMALNGYFQI